MVLIYTLKEIAHAPEDRSSNLRTQHDEQDKMTVIPAPLPTDGRQRKETQLEAWRRAALSGI